MGAEAFVRLPNESKVGETGKDAEAWIATKTLGVTKIVYDGYNDTVGKESKGHSGHDQTAVHDEGILVVIGGTSAQNRIGCAPCLANKGSISKPSYESFCDDYAIRGLLGGVCYVLISEYG